MDLRPLKSGNILITTTPVDPEKGKADSIKLAPIESVNSAGLQWTVSELNINGTKYYSAGISDLSSRLSLLCSQQSSDFEMQVELNEVLWKAIAYSVKIDNETLAMDFTVGGQTWKIADWDLVPYGLTVRLSAPGADEVTALKKASVAKFDIYTLSSKGVKSEIGKLTFPLKGSSKAISNTEKNCASSLIHEEPTSALKERRL